MNPKLLLVFKRAYLILISLLVLFFSLFSNVLLANATPYQLMEEVGANGFGRIKNEHRNLQADPEMLKMIVEEEFMPYVNYKYAALKLLGPSLKQADKNEVGEFITAFRGYLVTSYSQVLTQYSGQELRIGKERKISPTQRIIGVSVEIILPDRPPIKLEFKWRREKSGEWLVYDLIAEGVSLLSSKQAEWGSTIRQDGIPAVSEELIRLSELPIKYQESK